MINNWLEKHIGFGLDGIVLFILGLIAFFSKDWYYLAFFALLLLLLIAGELVNVLKAGKNVTNNIYKHIHLNKDKENETDT